MKMEGDFINTVISILLLEGIGRQLDPDLDLFASALPMLRKLGGQMAVNKELPVSSSNFGLLFKVGLSFFLEGVSFIVFQFWMLAETRSLITSAIVNADDMIKYDL